MQTITANQNVCRQGGARNFRCLTRTKCTQTAVHANGATPSLDKRSIRSSLLAELEGTERGIFGIAAAKKSTIHGLIEQLESINPLAAPTQSMDRVAGSWKLLYSTISISGVKRTKLGLREFVKLGDFIQDIDPITSLAVNKVAFSVSGLGMIKGALTITASFQPVSEQRVAITFQNALLAPTQLQMIFKANYDLLLSIFNPEGYLDITYVDDELRVGRDDKGNLFLLERCSPMLLE